MGYEEVKAIFNSVVEERGLNWAYQAFQSQAIRDSMHISWKIWTLLSKGIREEITNIKSNIKEETGSNDRSDKPKPKPKDIVIPPQYGLKRKVNVLTQDEDNDRLANLLESYHIDNDDLKLSDPDEEEDIQMGVWS